MERLKQYLKDRGISQVSFAETMSVSQPTVSGWLNDESLPSVPMLKKLSIETGLSIDELLDHVIPGARPKAPRAAARE